MSKTNLTADLFKRNQPDELSKMLNEYRENGPPHPNTYYKLTGPASNPTPGQENPETWYSSYDEKAKGIRQGLKSFKEKTEADKTLDRTFKQQTISKAEMDAQHAMDEVRKQYTAAKEAKIKDMKADAFRCGGSDSEYLTMMNQADAMSVEQRQRAAANAITIGAKDSIRAIAHSAHTAGDTKTLQYIVENADSAIADPIRDFAKPRDALAETMFEGTMFYLPGAHRNY